MVLVEDRIQGITYPLRTLRLSGALFAFAHCVRCVRVLSENSDLSAGYRVVIGSQDWVFILSQSLATVLGGIAASAFVLTGYSKINESSTLRDDVTRVFGDKIVR